MSFMNQPVPREDLETVVLTALEAGAASIHEVKDKVRLQYPGTRLYVVQAALLALSGSGRVQTVGAGETQRYIRRA